MTTKNEDPSSTVIGTGLVALDAVINTSAPERVRQWTGGTCGNVLLALRFLGWQAKPVCRLGADEAADAILSDLKHWKVQTKYVSQDADGNTPIIVHKISRNAAGGPVHSFSWRCPSCGTRFPGYKPVLASKAEEIASRIRNVQAFFFDRLSRGALILARACAERGAVVIFEPSGVNNVALFREACEIAHVIKYSHERLSDVPAELDSAPSMHLQIETLGELGLRYRVRKAKKSLGEWITLDACSVEHEIDTAGAGDWCTAGIISRVASSGVAGFRELSAATFREAIRFGQALGAWTCGFEGARGGMYSVSRSTFRAQVEEILQGEESRAGKILKLKSAQTDGFGSLCSLCGPRHTKTHRRAVRSTG
jgi:fructokinase